MLRATHLTLARGARRLLEDAELAIAAGHKVGLVGPNGCGKSSVFALLRGELLPERGEIDIPPGWMISYVAQEDVDIAAQSTEQSAIDYVLSADSEWSELDRSLRHAESHRGERLAELHMRYEDIDGYGVRARTAALLAGLGFSAAQQRERIATFSGGWRVRLALARALMRPSDLLLLDEPTNHLDLDAVLWLEEWLKRYSGTLLLVTHDREFLDATVERVVHFDALKLVPYAGNYSAFEVQRAERLAVQQANYLRQQRETARLRIYIDRFRAKATKAKQAQSRMKTLAKMEKIAAAHIDSPFSFAFFPPLANPVQLISLRDAQFGYRSSVILREVTWSIRAGERIGLLGANGAGKSTLLKTLADELPLLGGELQRGQGLRIGYFAQHQLEQLRGDESALWHLRQLACDAREQVLRDFLGGFDFRGDHVFTLVRQLSGGEKARLALACLVWQRPNLLLLDEPTNHLDIDMRQAVSTALQDYEGALIVVAHDRYLLRATTDTLWLAAHQRLQPFAGDLDDYRVAITRERDLPSAEAVNKPGRKNERRAEAEERQRLAKLRKPLLREIEELESTLATLTRDRQGLESWLASTEAYVPNNKTRLRESIKRQGEITQLIADAETRWLTLQQELAWIR